MPTLELVPDGDSGVNWDPFDPNPTGADNYTVVDDGSTSIDETDYVNTITDGHIDLYHWEDAPGGVLTTTNINSVTIYFRAKNTNNSVNEQIKGLMYVSPTYYYTDVITLTSSWATYSYTWTANPATTIAWTPANINNNRWGMAAAIARGRFNRCWVAAVWLVVDYTAVVGYTNDVIGVDSGNIAKINGIATADISKVNGV